MTTPTRNSIPMVRFTVTSVQVDVLLAALNDGAEYRRGHAAGYCLDCECEPGKLCADHARDLDAADDYDDLAAELEAATPATTVLGGAA